MPRPIVQELAVALVMEHARKDSNLAKRKMGTLHGLDAIAKRLNPAASVITGYTGVVPRFVGKKPGKLNGWD